MMTDIDVGLTDEDRAAWETCHKFALEVMRPAGRAGLVQTGIAATRTGGTTVCVGAPPMDETITIAPAVLFTASQKKLLGCILGSSNSLREIPRLIGLWQAGRLDLDALVTARRPLADINEAVTDLRAGRGIRTVLAP